MNFDELEIYFSKRNCGSYDRENYDKYLKANNFSFDIPSIHITGTNGKGSTANYIYQIYLKAGYKVGLYNSPYLNSVDEMISINGKSIEKTKYLSLFDELKDGFEKFNLSAFEMQTIIAYELFKREKLDIVIVEVGMGGYIDATNIITPVLSIITSISLEHTNYLGFSTSEIAYNKAGIIKDRVPVLIGSVDEDALFTIKSRAKKTKSELRIAPDYFNEKIVENCVIFDCKFLHDVKLNTACLYQAKNANLAIEAINILKNKFPVDDQTIRDGLFTNTMSCRFDFIKPNILVDGAHNPEAIRALVDSIKLTINKRIHIVFACFRDKQFSMMLNTLDEISDDITLTSFDHPRAKTKNEYLLFLETYKFADDFVLKVKELEQEFLDDVILITGGLYFAGLAKRELLK